MRRAFYAIAALQLLFILAIVAAGQWTLHRGQVVLLRVRPVDPRSLFLGNYLDLQYEIGLIDLDRLQAKPAKRPLPGETVYVQLRRGRPYARVVAVSRQAPPRRQGEIWLRGDVQYWPGAWRDDADKSKEPLPVSYDLERYYIPEARQDELARLKPTDRISVEVAVTSGGWAVIRRVFVNGTALPY